MTQFRLDNFASGALTEKFNIEMQKVLDNLADPNTDPKKARTITMAITLKSNDKRELAVTDINVKSALAPARPVQTEIILGRDADGKVEGAELKSGAKNQMMMDNDGDLADDKGNKVQSDKPTADGGKVVKFK